MDGIIYTAVMVRTTRSWRPWETYIPVCVWGGKQDNALLHEDVCVLVLGTDIHVRLHANGELRLKMELQLLIC